MARTRKNIARTGRGFDFKPSDISRKIDVISPTRFLTESQANDLIDFARNGSQPRLQRIYEEMEKSDEIIISGKRLRISAITEKPWRIVPKDESNPSEHQIAWLEETFNDIDNLRTAIERLALANFRGYAALNPVYEDDDKTLLKSLDPIPNQNLVYNAKYGKWLWNENGNDVTAGIADEITDYEDGIPYIGGLPAIPDDEIVIMTDETPIDRALLVLWLRAETANHDYGHFIQNFGIPPVILTLPEYIQEGQEEAYFESVEAMVKGGSGVVPFGTEIHYASEARGTDPFAPFIKEMQRQMARLITGSSLLIIPESGTGTLAGTAQAEAFDRIVRRDLTLIAETINKQLVNKLIQRKFNEKPNAIFEFEIERKKTDEEIFDLAKKAREAGYELDVKQLEADTACSISKTTDMNTEAKEEN